MGKEKRKHPRADVNLDVSYRVENEYADRITNLSGGGAFIETPRPLWADTVLTLTFNLPDTPGPIQVRAKVMWVMEAFPDEQGGAGASGMGLMFVDISEDARRKIEAYVATQEPSD
ncbi:MAG: PilZ domain-containing protein [Nitrospirae bacterium]|nr:PilZ domain-containing protein [Nitrospirota bacterium]